MARRSRVWLCTIPLLVACTSPASRLYLLEPVQVRLPADADTGPTVVVGPVVLPEYLRRREILSQRQHHRVTVAEFDRWAEPLEDHLTSTLAENLSRLLPSEQVFPYPAVPPGGADFRVRARFAEFGVSASGEVALDAVWRASDRSGRTFVVKRSQFREPIGGDGIVSIVSAMSRSLEQLGREIAGALRAATPESK